MIEEKYINRDWDCPEDDCGKSGMTEREFTNHGIEEHPEKSPFTDLFPEYYVCRCGSPSGDAVDVYSLLVQENGPYYMAWGERDYVDEMHPYELLRHDWERVDREETPFPRFEK